MRGVADWLIFRTERSTDTTRKLKQHDYRGRGRERLVVARRRAWRRAWSCNRLWNYLLQITPMKRIANDCTGYQDEANQKNSADTVGKLVAMLRAVFF